RETGEAGAAPAAFADGYRVVECATWTGSQSVDHGRLSRLFLQLLRWEWPGQRSASRGFAGSGRRFRARHESRGGRRTGLSVAGAVAGVRAIVRNGAGSVEFDCATGGEEIFELPAGPLHAGLHPGRGDAELGGRLLVGLSVQVDPSQGVAGGGMQLGEERLKAVGKLAGRLVGFVAG